MSIIKCKWMGKQDPAICCLQETPSDLPSEMHRLNIKEWKKTYTWK